MDRPLTEPAQIEPAEAGSLQTLLKRVWRRKGRFAAVFLTVIGLTVVALLVLPVRYMATGSIIVAEQEPGVNSASAAYVQKIGDPADLESQLLVIRSPRVMRLAMSEKVLDAATEECRASSGGLLGSVLGSGESCDRLKRDSAAFVDYVQTRYSIGAVGRSRVINISYQSPIAEVAKTMADALTTAFLDDQRACDQVMQGLFALGKAGHDKSDIEGHAADDLSEKATRRVAKSDSLAGEIGDLQSQGALAEGGLMRTALKLRKIEPRADHEDDPDDQFQKNKARSHGGPHGLA